MTNVIPVLKDSLGRLREEIDHTFDWLIPKRRESEKAGMFAPLMSSFFSPARPVVDMEEDENEFRVNAELPGLEKEDFKVELVGNQLVIRGEKKAGHEEKKRNFYYSECSYGSFSRSIPLPDQVDPNKIEATYKNGILSVHLPKTEQAKAKKVDVKVA